MSAGAEELARALGGFRCGACWMARCPAHEDGTPSLSITVGDRGRVLVHCHAGCRQVDVISVLRDRGLWHSGAGENRQRDHQFPPKQHIPEARDSARHAFAILEACRGAAGTPVQTYLRARGITLPLPPDVLFHPSLRHPTGSRWPAMVCVVRRGEDGEGIGIHRTFLARDGLGKAPVEPDKMMLGPCRGGAVRLGRPGPQLMVAEGIETAMAATQATALPAWAALSTSGLRTLVLPRAIEEVVILADGDAPGEEAALAAAARWSAEGRHVRVARAPLGFDFNDVLCGRTAGVTA